MISPINSLFGNLKFVVLLVNIYNYTFFNSSLFLFNNLRDSSKQTFIFYISLLHFYTVVYFFDYASIITFSIFLNSFYFSFTFDFNSFNFFYIAVTSFFEFDWLLYICFIGFYFVELYSSNFFFFYVIYFIYFLIYYSFAVSYLTF
jgi:hypothetical protein